MRYAQVQDGQVVKGPMILPYAWENITGFNLMTDEELKDYGWLPWRFVEIEAGPDDVMTGSTVVVGEDEVVETQTKRRKTDAERAEEAVSLAEAHKAARAEAYRNEADPLFFQAQRGEATMQQWNDKVAEIKARYP